MKTYRIRGLAYFKNGPTSAIDYHVSAVDGGAAVKAVEEWLDRDHDLQHFALEELRLCGESLPALLTANPS